MNSTNSTGSSIVCGSGDQGLIFFFGTVLFTFLFGLSEILGICNCEANGVFQLVFKLGKACGHRTVKVEVGLPGVNIVANSIED